MTSDTASLIKRPDPDAVMRVADRISVRFAWPALCEEIARLSGAPCASIEASAPTIIEPDTAESDERARFSSRYQSADGRATVDIAVDGLLAALFCARRFGGSASAKPKGKGGAVERSIAKRIADAVIADLSHSGTSWVPLAPAKIDIPVEVSVAQSLTLPIGAVMGPHIDVALSGPALIQPSGSNDAEVWRDTLVRSVRDVRVPIRTVLARPVISAGEVARLRIGDVIPIRAPSQVTLLAGNQRLATGTLTELDGHAAIRIEPSEETSE